MPSEDRPRVYMHGRCEIDLGRRELRVDGTPVPIGSRTFQLVEALVTAQGRLLAKDALLEQVWAGLTVGENALHAHISALRKALGPQRDLLKTATGRGYRLLGDWQLLGEPDQDPVDPGDAAPAIVATLPSAGSSLIGRDANLRHVLQLLGSHRLITLTGPPGIGKTTLALAVAREFSAALAGGGYLVDLAPLADPGLAPSAVAAAAGLKLGGGAISAEAIARGIGDLKMLLVLDNCEHIIDALAVLAETLVQNCANLSVIATSRELLRVEGEYVYRVPALQVPPSNQSEADAILGHSAVALFLTRLSALDSDFALRDDELPDVATICRRLDGIPLAIEFAATRAAVLGIRQAAEGLHDRFNLLTHGRRTALPRQQTLRAALDWSYELLSRDEQRILRHLAVFAGGFSLDAAIAVIGQDDATLPFVANGLASLVAKSLVATNEAVAAGRWRLLETIRDYGREKLLAANEAEPARRRHAGFYHQLWAANARPAEQPPAAEELERHGRDLGNLRLALDWSFSATGDATTGIALTVAFVPVWVHLGLMAECRERCEHALQHSRPGAAQTADWHMRLLLALAVTLTFTLGPMERTKAVATEALRMAEACGDVDAQLRALWVICTLHMTTGECRDALAAAERFGRVARLSPDPAAALIGERLVGSALQTAGQQGAALVRFERVLTHYVAPPDGRHVTWFHFQQRTLARAMLARALWLQGRADQAIREAEISLAEAQSASHVPSMLWALGWAVFPISAMTGHLTAAEQALTMMLELAARHNAMYWLNMARCLEGALLIRRGEWRPGAQRLRAGLELCEASGWMIGARQLLGMLAEAQLALGEHGQALASIERAVTEATTIGEGWYLAELLRIKGEILRSDGHSPGSAAEACFRQAIDLAHEQGALFFELRAATSLARWLVAQDRRGEALDVLVPTCQHFTEGANTPDMRSARSLLAALQSEAGDGSDAPPA